MIALLMAAAAVLAQDAHATEPPIAVPLEGLKGACCEKPVQEALSRIEHVHAVKLARKGAQHIASVTMNRGRTLALSAIAKALDAPNRDMGQQMGTTYRVAAALPLDIVYAFQVHPDTPHQEFEDVQKALEKAFKKDAERFRTWASSREYFGIVIQAPAHPTVDAIKKASKVEVVDVLLAAHQGGKRYVCGSDPAIASASKGLCPIDQKPLEEIPVSRLTAAPPPPPPPPKGD